MSDSSFKAPIKISDNIKTLASALQATVTSTKSLSIPLLEKLEYITSIEEVNEDLINDVKQEIADNYIICYDCIVPGLVVQGRVNRYIDDVFSRPQWLASVRDVKDLLMIQSQLENIEINMLMNSGQLRSKVVNYVVVYNSKQISREKAIKQVWRTTLAFMGSMGSTLPFDLPTNIVDHHPSATLPVFKSSESHDPYQPVGYCAPTSTYRHGGSVHQSYHYNPPFDLKDSNVSASYALRKSIYSVQATIGSMVNGGVLVIWLVDIKDAQVDKDGRFIVNGSLHIDNPLVDLYTKLDDVSDIDYARDISHYGKHERSTLANHINVAMAD